MTDTATVETLTAEVRVLMVGNRQVTLSVYRQLDEVPIRHVEVMGRVHARKFKSYEVETLEWVGRHCRTGALVRGEIPEHWRYVYDSGDNDDNAKQQERKAAYMHVAGLPLIVLAGLR